METVVARGTTQFKIILMKDGSFAICDRTKLPARKGCSWKESEIKTAATGGYIRPEGEMQIKHAKDRGDYCYFPDSGLELYPTTPRGGKARERIPVIREVSEDKSKKDIQVHFFPGAEKYINLNGPSVAQVLRERKAAKKKARG